jgi:hypothetical protein
MLRPYPKPMGGYLVPILSRQSVPTFSPAAGVLKEGDPASSLLSESCMFSPTALNVERFWPVCLSSQVSSLPLGPKPLKFLGTKLPRAEGARNRRCQGC